jgi:hypothetical protein
MTFYTLTYITRHLLSLQESLTVTIHNSDNSNVSTATQILLRRKYFTVKRPNCVNNMAWVKDVRSFLKKPKKSDI